MANQEQVDRLRASIEAWNRWRREHPGEKIDLIGANLIDANLREANMRKANLSRADLIGANLSEANLSRADLIGANLGEANLREANLSKANLIDANLSRAKLRGADLSKAFLSEANLRMANLREANLGGAKLFLADLRSAELSRANLREADLSWANLSRANLSEANLSGAVFNNTSASDDLSSAIGLETIDHKGPSPVTLNSILSFTDDLPEKFLRGCGVEDEDIAYFRSRVGKPIRHYTCFISYSSDDEEFADRLYNDFQGKGIRCWKWNHDAKTGKSLWGEIDQAIRIREKLVLVASEASLKSPAVCREIERALVLEDERTIMKQAGTFHGDVDVLFPVRLDDYVLNGWIHERAVDVRKKVIADARDWEKDNKVYSEVRDRLVKDLIKEPPEPLNGAEA